MRECTFIAHTVLTAIRCLFITVGFTPHELPHARVDQPHVPMLVHISPSPTCFRPAPACDTLTLLPAHVDCVCADDMGAQVLTERGRAVGVALQGGGVIRARKAVISSALSPSVHFPCHKQLAPNYVDQSSTLPLLLGCNMLLYTVACSRRPEPSNHVNCCVLAVCAQTRVCGIQWACCPLGMCRSSGGATAWPLPPAPPSCTCMSGSMPQVCVGMHLTSWLWQMPNL